LDLEQGVKHRRSNGQQDARKFALSTTAWFIEPASRNSDRCTILFQRRVVSLLCLARRDIFVLVAWLGVGIVRLPFIALIAWVKNGFRRIEALALISIWSSAASAGISVFWEYGSWAYEPCYYCLICRSLPPMLPFIAQDIGPDLRLSKRDYVTLARLCFLSASVAMLHL